MFTESVPEQEERKYKKYKEQLPLGNAPVAIRKGKKQFTGICLLGQKDVPQEPQSAVQLNIPEGQKGFISGHVHTDLAPFLDAIPDSECPVSPIVEYNFQNGQKEPGENGGDLFEINIPHVIKNEEDRKKIIVWHGDVHKKIPFTKYDKYTVHEKHITVYTSHFSQYMCTVCSESCQGNAKVFIFGHMTPLNHPPLKSTVRIYICNPLYEIQDFKKVKIVKKNHMLF